MEEDLAVLPSTLDEIAETVTPRVRRARNTVMQGFLQCLQVVGQVLVSWVLAKVLQDANTVVADS